MGMILKCKRRSIVQSYTKGRYDCTAHGSVIDDKICPKQMNKYLFNLDCWDE